MVSFRGSVFSVKCSLCASVAVQSKKVHEGNDKQERLLQTGQFMAIYRTCLCHSRHSEISKQIHIVVLTFYDDNHKYHVQEGLVGVLWVSMC